MIYAVCPSDVVEAPAEVVWSLLTDPAGWGDVFDATVLSVEPAGPAIVGQRVLASSGRWPARFRLRFEFTRWMLRTTAWASIFDCPSGP